MPGPLTVILPRSFYFDKTSEAVSRLRVVFMLFLLLRQSRVLQIGCVSAVLQLSVSGGGVEGRVLPV